MTGGPEGSEGLGDAVASAVGLAAGVADVGIGTGEAEVTGVAAVGLATGVADDGIGTGTGEDAEEDGKADGKADGEADALGATKEAEGTEEAVGEGTGVAVDPIGTGTGEAVVVG